MRAFTIILGAAAWTLLPEAGSSPEVGGFPPADLLSTAQRVATAAIDPRPEVALIVFDADTVLAKVMDTPTERNDGLQFYDELPDGSGMLFVFESEEYRSFWMKDTYIALDIAFLNVSFRIVDIQQMEPQTEDLYNSTAPAMFALEVRKGWFAERGIQVGAKAKVVFDPPGVRIKVSSPPPSAVEP
jgi:uncharacterized membrane protein (UPF0127 family)